MLLETVNLTGFGKKTQGKVRDIYIQDNKRILVTTDRQSAFDVNLGLIPNKGQVLNLLSKFWFENTNDIVPNHFISLPHPNVMIVKNCQPITIEMVVRGYISGVTTTSIWYSYERGERVVYGIRLPEGLKKNQKLETPIITPTTHGGGAGGHDERLTEAEILKRKLVSPKLYRQMKEVSLKLFQRGTEIAARAGLMLVDTKYEFGLYQGKLMLIDEIHTPDSSRFWIKETYLKRFTSGEEPENFDKEFLRLWFVKRGYRGDGIPPKMPPSFIAKVSERYIKVYEKLTMTKYIPDNSEINLKPKYALLSVFDKTGVIEFAKSLKSLGYSIISTGGTAKILKDNGLEVISIEKITKNPESFDGRMKTISFQIEGGILFDRENPIHQKQAQALGIKPINLVVCNFYPFDKKQTIENVDVGGPTMVRAGAKNYKYVTVVVDPNDYPRVINSLNDIKIRKELAAKAFRLLTYYDSQVAKFLTRETFPEKITLAGFKVQDLRYGENPHQKAGFYSFSDSTALAKLEKKWGRDLSLVNITDINAGIEAVRLFKEPCAVVIKHNSPCGIALGKTVSEAVKRAIEADVESAFGGIIIVNKTFGKKASLIIGSHIDILSAPTIQNSALEFLKKLRKSMGIYTFEKMPKKDNQEFNVKWVDGGFILQTPDNQIEESFKAWKIVTKIKPSVKQISQMQIGWKFISRIKSNSVIVIDKTIPMTRGIGSGQTSRVRSTKIALEQAGKHGKSGILVSDSFFPFADSVKLAHESAIGAIIQQGGSINDQKVIDTANKLGIAMVFTGRRAFWH